MRVLGSSAQHSVDMGTWKISIIGTMVFTVQVTVQHSPNGKVMRKSVSFARQSTVADLLDRFGDYQGQSLVVFDGAERLDPGARLSREMFLILKP